MPRRSTPSATEGEQLLALTEAFEEFIRQYMLLEAELSLIRRYNGALCKVGRSCPLIAAKKAAHQPP